MSRNDGAGWGSYGVTGRVSFNPRNWSLGGSELLVSVNVEGLVRFGNKLRVTYSRFAVSC